MITLAGRLRCDDLVIVSDRDKVDPRTGVAPGMHYALKLASEINNGWRRVRVIQPPEGFKDLRDWYRAGARVQDLFHLVWSTPVHQAGRMRLMGEHGRVRVRREGASRTFQQA